MSDVSRDVEKAVTLFDTGCTAGVAEACLEVGVLYREGREVEANFVRAAANLDKACTAGRAGPARSWPRCTTRVAA